MVGRPLKRAAVFANRMRKRMAKKGVTEGRLKRSISKRTFYSKDNRFIDDLESFFVDPLEHFFDLKISNPYDCFYSVARLIAKSGHLRVLDVGSGTGFALQGLKKELEERGLTVHATALDSQRKPAFGNVDEVITSLAETFVPSRPYDLVLDYFGGLSYTKPFLRKDLLLKNANSLSKRGVLLVRFDFSEYFDSKLRRTHPNEIQGGFSEKPKRGRVADSGIYVTPFAGGIPGAIDRINKIRNYRPRRIIDFRKEARGIERSFEKRGFRAKFYFEELTNGFYKVALVVQRAK